MSSARFFQVLRQAASEALLEDMNVLKPALDILRAQKNSSVFAGTQVQQTNLFMAIGWDSAEDYASFKSSSTYIDFVSALQPALATGTTADSSLIHFKEDPLPALEAPFTEFLWLPLKAESQSKGAELEEAVKGVESVLAGAVTEKLSSGGFGGKYVDSGDFLLFAGWTSPEVVPGYVKRPEKWAIIAKVIPLTDFELTFAKLTSYKE